MTPSIADLIDELSALLEKATAEPWLIRTLENFGFNIVHYVDGDKFNIQRVAKAGDEDDAKLIVALRNNAKPLLDALQSLQAERDEVFAEAIEWRDKLTAAQETIGRYREALRPFAGAMDAYGDIDQKRDRLDGNVWEHPIAMDITLGDFINARKALETEGAER